MTRSGRLLRRPLLATLLVLLGAPGAAELDPPTAYDLVGRLMAPEQAVRHAAAERLIREGGPGLLPGLVDALFFIPYRHREEALEVLRTLSGSDPGSHFHDWVELVGRRTDLVPVPGYLQWKAALFRRIDPGYEKIFYRGAPVAIRPEEILSGGVVIDGIPPLEDPAHGQPGRASYLRDEEAVLGVSAGGAHRAYPVRILSWHEMANDTLGGEPITLSYCTLCGSAIAYSRRLPDGRVVTLGTSGLLYRSNKLMVDRDTSTLWSNLTGEPVLGRLVGAVERLETVPVTRTTWGSWRHRHPDTTALLLDRRLRELGRRHGYRYLPGAADRAREGVSFPVWLRSDRLPPRAEVYGLRIGGAPKAYPLERLLAAGVVHDRLGGTPLVVLADPESGAVRAYRRDENRFRRGDAPDLLVDRGGGRWRVEEEGLRPLDGGELLPRLPGHVAFWFGWYAFFPATEVYGEEGERMRSDGGVPQGQSTGPPISGSSRARMLLFGSPSGQSRWASSRAAMAISRCWCRESR